MVRGPRPRASACGQKFNFWEKLNFSRLHTSLPIRFCSRIELLPLSREAIMLFDELAFQYPFRKYQRMILDTIVPENADNKYHLVAPPGSGKTIIGLELIRRFDQPAVVFAPTTTIQLQWQEKVGMFTTDPAAVARLTSTDPRSLRPINIFTYQLISAPEASQKRLHAIAEKMWVEDLLLEGQAADEQAARQRLEDIRRKNPARYRRERSRRAARAKRKLLRDPHVDIAGLLHPNARRLIDDLVAYGVRTVVLDECHHLLDYWAIVLRYLIRRVENPRVIGLTATLPSPEGDDEFENYDALLGEVDFEVPAPAVVKEGDLAPYRDLAVFVRPTQQEREYLRHIAENFAAAMRDLTARPAFRSWLEDFLLHPQTADGKPLPWEELWRRYPLLAVAGFRYLRAEGWQPPADLPLPLETTAPLQVQDWMQLVERYGLDVLALSEDPADHDLLKRLRQVLYGYGFTLTERGLRQSRSAGDMVLAFSESKDHAVAAILEREQRALGERLRAVVVTDFERLNSGAQRLKGVLARDAGSAWRLFAHLARQPHLVPLNPVLVTGRTVRCALPNAEALVTALNARLEAAGASLRCQARPLDEAAAEIVGQGKGWTPRVYVPLLTDLFEEGVIRCLVGTRGILGEGWDAVKLNTLIDLTSVTTSTAVQQLRGRSLRKDPDWPHKVAHNWDVVCVTDEFERGDRDFQRFLRRHSRYWGLMLFPRTSAGALTNPLQGRVVKGWPHVFPLLFDWLSSPLGLRKFSGLGRVNRYMLRAAKEREWVYRMWRVGEEYSNFSYRATQLQVADLKIRTVYTLNDTVKGVVRHLLAGLLSAYVFVIYLEFANGLHTLALDWESALWILVAIPLAGALLFNLRGLRRAFRTLFARQPPDAILRDVALAVLAALRESGQVSRHLQDDFIRVYETADYAYQVLVDYASPEDSDRFARAVEQVFAPIYDQRYLILRTDRRLPSFLLRPFWWMMRWLVHRGGDYPPAYYPVPDALARRKELALTFARYWRQYVGGGELVFTRSDAGRAILLRARAQRRPQTKQMAFEFWR
ncbi:MAG: hypothetical protein D6803_08340 [Anaerolineae bacterium]|nr:MAG: hypothetical protein D6803_08340 [Anaerolineae bacterium]